MERARSFGEAADAYERGRPGYPEAALDWTLEANGAEPLRRVLDLGAGTGKLTRQLVARGFDVAAVEPAAGMRELLATEVPECEALAGDAEHIPLDDDSVDAVLAAQAWHWFDAGHAPPEIARVLRPGGRLGILWNLRDDGEGWVSKLSEILWDGGDGTKNIDKSPPPDPGEAFDPLEVSRFTHAEAIDAETLRDLVRSRSYFIVAPQDEQETILAGVDELLATHPDLAGRAEFDLPYVTLAFRTLKRP